MLHNLVFVALLVSAGVAHAQSQTSPAQGKPSASSQLQPKSSAAPSDYLRRSEDILKRAGTEFADPDLVPEQVRIDAARRISQEAGRAGRIDEYIPPSARKLPAIGGMAAAPSSLDNSRATSYMDRGSFVFVSTSMPDADLLAAFEAAADNGSVVLFRGVLKGHSLNTTFANLQRLIGRLANPPLVNVDPRPFSEYDVGTVPSVVVYQGTDFVKVSGTASTGYAKRLFDEKRFGDAGSRGPTRAIAEPDLLEEMKERLARIDWDAKKQGAVQRFWKNIKFHALPNATVSEVRLFDPTVTVDSEIKSPDGQLIAPAGATFNPLDIVAFSKTIVAFDATNKDQLEFARRVAEEDSSKGLGVILLTTAIDHSRPWESFDDYSKVLFPHRLFVLDDLVASRFGIQSVPSVIRPQGNRFRVEQVAVKPVSTQ